MSVACAMCDALQKPITFHEILSTLTFSMTLTKLAQTMAAEAAGMKRGLAWYM
jgi:hypothetical protein